MMLYKFKIQRTETSKYLRIKVTKKGYLKVMASEIEYLI